MQSIFDCIISLITRCAEATGHPAARIVDKNRVLIVFCMIKDIVLPEYFCYVANLSIKTWNDK